MKLFPNSKLHTHDGFTLMEVMVSVTIFAIVITIGIGSLLTIYSTLRKTRADQQVMDSLSFVMDTMTRRIRTGIDYVEIGSGSGIHFTDQEGDKIAYESGVDSINTNLIRLYFTNDADGIRYDITPDNLNIENFNIDVSTPGDGQPLVQINLSGVIKNGKKETPLSIQAEVSQRVFQSSSGSTTGGGGTGGVTPPPPIITPCPPRQACTPTNSVNKTGTSVLTPTGGQLQLPKKEGP